jgi:hypothetical protein
MQLWQKHRADSIDLSRFRLTGGITLVLLRVTGHAAETMVRVVKAGAEIRCVML